MRIHTIMILNASDITSTHVYLIILNMKTLKNYEKLVELLLLVGRDSIMVLSMRMQKPVPGLEEIKIPQFGL